jgi:hypothetical protein
LEGIAELLCLLGIEEVELARELKVSRGVRVLAVGLLDVAAKFAGPTSGDEVAVGSVVSLGEDELRDDGLDLENSGEEVKVR